MRKLLITIFLATTAAISVAEPLPLAFASISFPVGWKVEVEKGTYTSSPPSEGTGRVITAQACTRSKEDCGNTCNPSELRSNFFYFFDAKSNAEYSQPTRTDEFEELSAIGAVGTPPIWIAATVICGSLGLVYIGAMSPSKDEAMTLLSSATESVRLAPNGSKPAK
jgi:hypothetical protein